MVTGGTVYHRWFPVTYVNIPVTDIPALLFSTIPAQFVVKKEALAEQFPLWWIRLFV